MNCIDITKHLSNIKDQITVFDDFVGVKKPTEAINIKNELNGLFDVELANYLEPFYRKPNQENYDKLVQKLAKKQSNGKSFTKKELVFIYEINYPLENSGGLLEDDRIKEIRDKLNHKENAPIVFDCKPDEIIWNDLGKTIDIPCNAKAYVGPLFPDIFTKLRDIEYIYTSFPENRIRRSELTIGGKTTEELEEKLKQNGYNVSDITIDTIRNPEFEPRDNTETIGLVLLKAADLGFTKSATTLDIYDKAKEYNLELCPPEVGFFQRFQDKDQPMFACYLVSMKHIVNSDGRHCVFYLGHGRDGLQLSSIFDLPTTDWHPDDEFLFRLPIKNVKYNK